MKRILILLLIFPLFFVGAQSDEDAGDRDLFFRAERRLDAADYALAVELYSRLGREYPLSSWIPDAQFRIGQCYYHLGQNDKALLQMERVTERYKMTRYAAYLPFWRGILSYKLGDWETAARELAEYIAEGSPSRNGEGGFIDVYRKDAYLYQALALKELGQKTEAASILKEIHGLFPAAASDPYLLTLLGNIYFEEGRLEELKDLLEPVDLVKITPPWSEHLSFLKAEVFLEASEEEEALSLYLWLTGTGSQAAGPAYERVFSIYLDRGEFDLLQGLIGRAEVDLREKAVLLDGFYLRAGIGFYKSGRIERADYFLQKVWAGSGVRDVSPLVPLYLSRMAAEEGDMRGGIEYLDSYLQLAVDGRERLLYTKGEYLTRLEAWEEALVLWHDFFEEYPDSEFLSPGSYHAGYTAYKTGEYAEAFDYFEEVSIAGLSGNQRKGLQRLNARLLGWNGHYKLADEAWEEYLILYPEDWSSRGEALKAKFLAGDYRGTVGAALLLKRRDETEADRGLSALAYYLSGLSFLAEDNYSGALEDFLPLTRTLLDKARIGDVFPFVLYYRGWAQYQSADYVRALRDFSELARILEDEIFSDLPSADLMTRATYLAGWCAYQLGDYEESAEFFRQYSEINEQPEQGLLMYARALAESGDNAGAAGVLDASFNSARYSSVGDDTLFELAGQLFLAGETEKAMGKYLELYEIYPASPLAEESLFQRGEKYLSLGEWEKAQDAFYLSRRSFPDGNLIAAAHYWGGVAARQGGEDFGAVLLWDRLLDEYPESHFRAPAYRNIGEIYMERGDYKKSLRYYEALAAEFPDEATSLEVATALETLRYLMLGEPEDIAALRGEISTYGGLEAPESREAMLELARILLYRGGDDRAEAKLLLEDLVYYQEEDLERAARAQYYLGEYFFRSGEYAQAEEAFLTAATMNSADGDLMAMSIFRAAEAAGEQNKRSTVRALVRRLEEAFPDSEWYREGEKLLETE